MIDANTAFVAGASIVAVVVAMLLKRVFVPKNKWKKMRRHNTPIWLMHALYKGVWSKGRKHLYADGVRIIRGSYFEYKVNFRRRVEEPNAIIGDIVVCRRVRPEKFVRKS